MIELALFALGLLLGYFIGWARYKRVLMRIPNLGPLVINAILQKKMDEASDLMQQKAIELVYDKTNYGSKH